MTDANKFNNLRYLIWFFIVGKSLSLHKFERPGLHNCMIDNAFIILTVGYIFTSTISLFENFC